MALTNPGFEVVGGTETESPKPVADHGAAIRMLTLALTALSQRALVAIADLFTLFTCTGAWYLWYSIPDPNDKQIISLSIYAAFTLAANYIVRRK